MPTRALAAVAPRAQQERSRRSAERIVAAALELLATKDFDHMSVAEIAARAGLSVGGFYARFSDKAALLEYLDSEVIDGLLAEARSALSAEALRGASARAVIERYIALAVRAFRKHKRVIAQVSLRSRTSADAAFRKRIAEANRTLHDLLRARLEERRSEIGHPRPRVAVDVALTAVSGAMREYVLFGELRPHFAPLSDRELAAQLTDLFCSYLRLRRRKSR
jgi:AcrR family transcriptional regulator